MTNKFSYCSHESQPKSGYGSRRSEVDQANDFDQLGVQGDLSIQTLKDTIILNNCTNVRVSTSQTQALLSLQAAIQATIVIVVNILVFDDQKKATKLTQDLFQLSAAKQSIEQIINVSNSNNCEIVAIDTQAAAQVQLFLQILLALLGQLGVINA